MKIYAFRHGQTDWNLNGRWQGTSDIPLNENGRRQALALRDFFSNITLDCVLSSDLQRAHHTALEVSRDRWPVHLTAGLRECELGLLEGQTRDSFSKQNQIQDWDVFMKPWIHYHEGGEDFRLANGESKRAHRDRVVMSIKNFIIENPHLQSLGVSAHGGSLLRLYQWMDPTGHIRLRNCEVILFELSDVKNFCLDFCGSQFFVE